jgi:hypothetical protein
MASNSYWQEGYVGSDKAKDDIKSWFGSMADDLTPYKAEILCDAETDREKKIRAFMTSADGRRHYQLERTLGRKTFTVSMKRIPDCSLTRPERA